MAGKPPGGQPESESNAFMERLKRKHESRVESQNARVQAMFGRLPAPPGGGGGKKGPPPGVHAPGTGPAPVKLPDPCEGRPLEIKAIQTTPPLDAGEKVLVEGCGFGYPTDPAPAAVFLFGDGFPGGRLKLDLEGTLPMGILARVPMTQGVPDMENVKLQVVRGGQVSKQFDVGDFSGTRDVKMLTPRDVEVSCWSAREQAKCMGASDPPSGEALYFAHTTFAAKHGLGAAANDPSVDCSLANTIQFDKFQDETDTYTVKTLNNGWVLAYYQWSWKYEDDGFAIAPQGFAADSKSSTIKMKWGLHANACGPQDSDVSYRVYLYAIGPKGIPYR